MSDDLKASLGKVLQGRGRKTYTFGYLAGKRKDNKGEGSLELVAGQKTFKKDDLDTELESHGTLYQGKCWADSEGQTLFFEGNSLTHAIVDKMKSMVAKTTGKSVHFDLPDADEEKRQAILAAAELEAARQTGGGQHPTSQPEPTNKPSPLEPGQVPIAPVPPGVVKKTAPNKPPVDPAARSYAALLEGMQTPLAELKTANPKLAETIQHFIDAAAHHAKPGEYPKAVQFLKEAGKALAKASHPGHEDEKTEETGPEEEPTPRPRVGGPADFPRLWKKGKEAWQTASDKVDGQIAALQAALRATGFKELKEIAEFGLNGATGNFKVPLMAVMRNVDAANGDAQKKEVANALKIVMGFRKHLKKSDLVAVVDDNPLKVPVTIQLTIGDALDQLEDALNTLS